MAGFSALQEEADRVMAATPYEEPLPMWTLLLYIAEPAGVYEYGTPDLDVAQQTLGWAQWLWNSFRLTTEQRQQGWEERKQEIEAFVGSIQDVLEMVMRAQSWQWDLRVVTRATIVVGPAGEWRLDVATT